MHATTDEEMKKTNYSATCHRGDSLVTPLLYEDEDRNPPIPNPSMAQPGASEIENRKSQITRIHPNPPEPQKMYSR